ncbi:MAG: Gfo/Idh/MocA family oxidoreductase [Chloroflexi bacterium]|nr:MAG: Gfo/Idh/MocA family oxidoreductase [Chloroflexota bacterium]
MAQALRVLQVGLGGWGRDWAWRVLPDLTEVELVGCVDPDPAALALVQKQAKVPAERCFATLESGLEATRAEAVLVTTILPGHATVTRAALEAGRHVLVEKPFTSDLAQARALVALADERELVLMVSQNYRFFPAVREVRRLVSEAPLGPLHAISIDFRQYSPVGPNGPGAHHAYAQPLLVDMSIHHFDLLRLILGREADSISCEAWNPPWSWFRGPAAAVATINFDSVVVSYRGSWISAGPITPWSGEWRMEFEDGEVLWSSRSDDASRADVVTVHRRGAKPVAAALPKLRRIDRWGCLAELVAAVRRRRQAESSARDNLGSLALMLAAVESAERRGPVRLDLKGTVGPNDAKSA